MAKQTKDARNLLRFYAMTLAQMEAKQDLYEKLKSMVSSVTSKMNDGCLPATRDHTRKYDTIGEAELMLERINEQLAEYLVTLRKCDTLIGSIQNPLWLKLIHLRHINNYSWRRIAHTLKISERHAQREHTRALERLQTLIVDIDTKTL